MKKIFCSGFTALMALGMMACSQEQPETVANVEHSLELTVGTPEGLSATRAIASSAGENTISNLKVFAMDMSNASIVLKTDDSDLYSVEQNVPGTAKVKFSQQFLNDNLDKSLSFFVFANNDDDLSSLTGYNSLTNALSSEIEEGEGLKTPLLMSARTAAITIGGVQSLNVSLARRSARFDISFPMAADDETSTTRVNSISIANYARQTAIFADASPATTPSANDIVLTTKPDGTPLTTNDYVDGVKSSAFYLFPGFAPAISIEVSIGGVTRTLTAQSTLFVLENKRYMINIDPMGLDFTVTVADYDEGGDLTLTPSI